MKTRIFALLLITFGETSFGASFPAFDTTVTVKTYTQKKTDTTFINLRKTGFILAYVLKSTEYCPQVTVAGDFELKANPRWLFSFYNNYGDSVNWPQTSVTYYCDYKVYSPFALPAKSKYQIHFWVDSNKVLDSIFTQIKEIVNDSTFTLSVSAVPFAIPTGTTRYENNKKVRLLDGIFTINGRRIAGRRIVDSPTKHTMPNYCILENDNYKEQ